MSQRPRAAREGAQSPAAPRGGRAARDARAPSAPASLATLVQRWQRQHGRRGLPWIGERDPYRVWLSEVMLQQTQVATVLDYYGRFLARFPDVQALAAAPLADVLALWSGLGYYSRARHLHRCAQAVVAEHGGHFPDNSEALARLPGIGRSTAAAIAAFCFGERAAILDGNVKRVLTRVLGFEQDLAETAGQRALWSAAEAQLPKRGIESYTQGIMDLGATVCLARQPLCAQCPLGARCVAHAQGRPHDYPVKTRKLVRGERSNVMLWLEHRGRFWLVRRPERGVWAGLACLPLFDDQAALAALTRGWPGIRTELPSFKHVLTHFDWMLQPVHWQWPARAKAPAPAALTALGEGRWFERDEALEQGLPAPIRRVLASAPGRPSPSAPRRVRALVK